MGRRDGGPATYVTQWLIRVTTKITYGKKNKIEKKIEKKRKPQLERNTLKKKLLQSQKHIPPGEK